MSKPTVGNTVTWFEVRMILQLVQLTKAIIWNNMTKDNFDAIETEQGLLTS